MLSNVLFLHEALTSVIKRASLWPQEPTFIGSCHEKATLIISISHIILTLQFINKLPTIECMLWLIIYASRYQENQKVWT